MEGRSPQNPKNSINVGKFPFIPLGLVGLGYVLVGWRLSAYNPVWGIISAGFAGIITVLLIWGTGSILRVMRLGPRSILTMLFLSSAVTMVVIASTIFALIAILLATETLVRLEMQAAGYRGSQILAVIMQVALLGILVGWAIGNYLVPGQPFLGL
ncbi:hypothetical protein L3556_03130 [Candidatus Synechococcus calcipolaris G9]|uniref:Yip1 domain-containing protein n=1 Tax=Candidatus Synechococcus calcipolaris G9 TaxID=1497997 RepID=A0ABT6EXG5_9SYNE|nr:hypothetical protein [Candidatus Synechococcus calcipolaris]MDG2989931.1 hypothetical protein [Candidatus Synechococcus calcipolaris G9]